MLKKHPLPICYHGINSSYFNPKIGHTESDRDVTVTYIFIYLVVDSIILFPSSLTPAHFRVFISLQKGLARIAGQCQDREKLHTSKN